MKYISAFISFAFVFAGVSFVAGWWLLPHLPPPSDQPVSVFAVVDWKGDWMGYLVGAVLGALSAWSVLRQAAKKSGG